MGQFAPVSARDDFAAAEREVMAWWRERGIMARYLERNAAAGRRWSFMDGPITANGQMGVHHAWGRTYKDLFQRYHTMLGHRQRYQNGFDCQGLWVEVLVERELGFRSKRDIETFGIAPFVDLCKNRVLGYAAQITEQSQRLGMWMDWNDPDALRTLADAIKTDSAAVVEYRGRGGAVRGTAEQVVGRLGDDLTGGSYFTFSDENNYAIWGFIKRCWERGMVYKGHDVMPWCPRCSTGISEHEIVTEGYREITHPGLFVRFPLVDEPGRSLLVWTTTPWTLTSNVAAAVHPELPYVRVHQSGEDLYLAEGTLGVLKGDYAVTETLPGSRLVGRRYRGPFDDLPPQRGIEHRVIPWKDVGADEGTGIVHIAPGCGAEDFALSKEHGLAVIAPIDEYGVFLPGFDWLTGNRVDEVAPLITEHLRGTGRLYKSAAYRHRYPVCWRCGTELVFRLVDEWFIAMDPVRERLMEITRRIRWLPGFGLDRELDWLNNMHDWMISKKRYWGLALPIWECDRCGHFEVIGSQDELRARATDGWETFAGHTPHRPWVDAVKIACATCGAVTSRVADVGNPWLDAGIVTFSTLEYRTDPAYWEQWFPADFITESFPGQYRNWFYSLLVMSAVLADREPFETCLAYASVRGEDGREMHKSWGNMIEFNEAADRAGVDVMRWAFCAQNIAANINFGYHALDDVRRRVVIPLWNVYAFFVTYANLERFDFPALVAGRPALTLLDRWLLSKTQALIAAVRGRLDDCDPQGATRPVEAFVDALSNWYVRRSRRRFWKSEDDADKRAAYATLYHALRTLALVLAPFMPFLSERLYQGLVRAVDAGAPESVHLCDFPQPDLTLRDPDLETLMDGARTLVGLGRAARSHARVKVRQPLPTVLVVTRHRALADHPDLLEQIRDELNVKSIKFLDDPSGYVTFEVKPRFEVLGPRFGPRVQAVASAVRTLDPAATVRRLQEAGMVVVRVDGDDIELTAADLEARMHETRGYAADGATGEFAILDTTLTPDLEREGRARELVHQVQTLRKDAGLAVDDRIVLVHDGGLSDLLPAFGSYIQRETLASAIRTGAAADGTLVAKDLALGGDKVAVGIARAGE